MSSSSKRKLDKKGRSKNRKHTKLINETDLTEEEKTQIEEFSKELKFGKPDNYIHVDDLEDDSYCLPSTDSNASLQNK